MKTNNWKNKMETLEIGQSFETDASHYNTLRSMRSKLRLNGFDFTFKIGKGRITTRRVA